VPAIYAINIRAIDIWFEATYAQQTVLASQ